MLNKANKIKKILSKLIVANKCYKKVLLIKKTLVSTITLGLLQKKGFIYGYTEYLKNNFFYIVFLKYSENNNSGLKNFRLLNISYNLKNLYFFEKNTLYFLLNNEGCFLTGISIKNKQTSGVIIAKL
jgi:ribosomal protein S8